MEKMSSFCITLFDNYGQIIWLVLGLLIIAGIVIAISVYAYKRYTYYPSLLIRIDISNKRSMSDNDAFDYYVINYGKKKILNHIEEIHAWKQAQKDKVKNDPAKVFKLEKKWSNYSYKAFRFEFTRTKTRYRQQNYQRYSYQVSETSNSFYMTEKEVASRIQFLETHGYYVTYDQYHRVDQRKALTRDMREFIKQRDNYTCQICGKYMPDEVGLHIDHILPIAKGGKSVPSNLRVLCSKCNGRKGDK